MPESSSDPDPVESTEAAAPDGAEPGRGREWAYLGAALLLLGVVLAIIEYEYSLAPVPPGVDPGDWIQRSYAFVGLAHPPSQAVGSPYLYPPLIFPFLGGLDVVTGSPLSTGFLFGGTVFAVFGLSTILLAWGALRSGPFRLAFVAIALGNGTLVSMLFWGAYPNIAGFAFFNLVFFFLIRFLETEGRWDAALLWVSAALTYLTHSLTFVMLGGALILVFAVVFLCGRFRWKWILNRGHQVGLAILIGTVAAYSELTRYFGIPHPDYYFSNPAAYTIDNLGELFVPMGSAPAITPMGASWYLPAELVLVVISVAGVVAILIPALLHRRRPGWVGPTELAAAGWCSAALLLPAGGYLFHIDTDYSRFAYFLPEPLALAGVVVVERLVTSREEPVAASGQGLPDPDRRSSPRIRGGTPAMVAVHGALVIGIVLLLVNITVPVAQAGEQSNTGSAHDQQFLDAAAYLDRSSIPGAVLTTQGSARWVEALSDRGAYDIGPTWLLFENWQVTNAELAYWGMNSFLAVTNNHAVISYSNLSTSLLNQAPMYSIYDEGINVPVLRFLPGATTANVTTGPSSQDIALTYLASPSLSWQAGPSPSATTMYDSAVANVLQTATLGVDGQAWVNYTFTPKAGHGLPSVQIALGPPPSNTPTIHAAQDEEENFSGSSFEWSQSVRLGQLPSAVNVTTEGTIEPVPQNIDQNATGLPGTVLVDFSNPEPASAFSVSFSMSTADTSNPATVLPAVMLTSTFLHEFDIHFLLAPNDAGYAPVVAEFQLSYKFRVVYLNSEWVVLQG